MRTQTLIIAIGVYLFTGIWAWATSKNGLCAMGIALEATTANSSTNCFEFWLNRYQGLISGFITLFTALIAAYLVWQQVRGTFAANEINSKIQAIEQYQIAEKRFENIIKSEDLIAKIQHIAMWMRTYEQFYPTYDVFDDSIKEIQRIRGGVIAAEEMIFSLKSGLTQGATFEDQIRPISDLLIQIRRDASNFLGIIDERDYADSEDAPFDEICEGFCSNLTSNGDKLNELAGEFRSTKSLEKSRLLAIMSTLEVALGLNT